MSSQQRHFCPLFADISGSKQLYEKLDDTEAMQAFERCINRLERAITSFDGRVVKHSRDQIMAVFDTAENALRAACEMQLRIEKLPAVSGVKLAIGIGFHFGPAQGENDDVSGDTVKAASRLVKLANAGQIITSDATVAALPPQLRQSALSLDSVVIKVNDVIIPAFAVFWQKFNESSLRTAAAVPAPASRPAPAPAYVPPPARLRLLHNGREITLGPDRFFVTLGRDAKCDLLITDPHASRHHCRIELRRDLFVLVDKSTNGTYVKPDGGSGFLLKGGEYAVKGRGRLSFGPLQEKDISDIVAYEVL